MRRNDTISRATAIKTIDGLPNTYNGYSDCYDKACIIGVLEEIPPVDAVEVIRCKDCIHKPKPTEDYKQGERDSGFKIEFPDYMCPLQCDDAYYSRLPRDDWFCGNAERRQDDSV